MTAFERQRQYSRVEIRSPHWLWTSEAKSPNEAHLLHATATAKYVCEFMTQLARKLKCIEIETKACLPGKANNSLLRVTHTDTHYPFFL